jgi:outer membrane receptor protein involved in Fe transport
VIYSGIILLFGVYSYRNSNHFIFYFFLGQILFKYLKRFIILVSYFLIDLLFLFITKKIKKRLFFSNKQHILLYNTRYINYDLSKSYGFDFSLVYNFGLLYNFGFKSDILNN